MSTIERAAIRRFALRTKGSALAQADAARDRGDWGQAVDLYRNYLKHSAGNFSIWVQLGHAFKESGRRVEALAAYSSALALKPNDADLLLNIAHLQKLMGHRQKAIDFYRQSMDIDGNAAAIDELRALGEHISTATSPDGDPERARKASSDRLAPLTNGSHPVARLTRRWNRLRANRLLSRANLSRDSRRWVDAAELYSQYLEARPQEFAIWVQLGHALKEAGRLDEALGAYEWALAIDNGDADLLLNLGHLYKVMGRRDRAADFYRRSAQSEPSGQAIAELAAMSGPRTEVRPPPPRPAAVAQQRPSASGFPGWRSRLERALSRRTLARADKARSRREWPTAAKLYRNYLTFRPDQFAIWVQLGHALKESGRPQAALDAYKQAMRLNSADACDLLTNFGHLFNGENQVRPATAFYGQSTKQRQLLESIDRVELVQSDPSFDLIGGQDRVEFQPAPVPTALMPGSVLEKNRKIGVFTIASKNYLAYVRVLMRSLAEFNPDYSLYLCLADKIDGYFDPHDECFEVIECQNIGVQYLEDMALRYDVMEFNTALKPFMFQWLLNNTDCDSIIYLDPDIRVFYKFDQLEFCLDSGASVVLTPHITRPLEDKKTPNDYNMLQSGTFNLGFVAINRCDEAKFFVDWWGRKLETGAYADFSQNLFTDQRWCDLAPSILNDLLILKAASYNVAYWNLAERTVCSSRGRWYANAEPLAFFHFSGVNAADDSAISKHQNRFDWADLPPLKPLFEEYRGALLKAGWEITRHWPYYYASTRDGLAISPILRSFYRQTMPDSKSFDDVSATELLLALSSKPEKAAWSDAEEPISQLMSFIRAQRPDLQATFDINTAHGRKAFHDWFASAALREYRLPSEIIQAWNGESAVSLNVDRSAQVPTLKTVGAGYGRYPNRINSLFAPAVIECYLGDTYISSLMHLIWLSRPDLQDAFDLNTAEGQRAFAQWYSLSAEREWGLDGQVPTRLNYARGLLTARAAVNEKAASPGANLIGYAHAVLGMGEHVRMSAAALEETGIPYGVFNFDVGVETRQGASLEHGDLISNNIHCANIFHINADQMLHAYAKLGHQFFANRYNIGYWAWELSKSPAEWQPVVDMIDEIWAPSRFIQDGFAEVSIGPVVYMPLCVSLPTFDKLDRRIFGIPTGAYAFLYTFDFLSYMDRKNPFAAISAFRQAFPQHESKACLVLKVLNGNIHSDQWQTMLQLIGDDDRIIVINKTLSRGQVLALFDACDCFVSLHRSEGFGRGPAEAMYLGKPVIVTNYSGNTDFTRPDNSRLVNYELIAVEKGQYPFHQGQVWADPDVEHAAWHMQQLFKDRETGQQLGERARIFIHENYNQSVIGRMYEARLRELKLI